MDLAAGGARVIAICYHCEKNGRSKLVEQLTYPADRARLRAQSVVTDLAWIDIDADGFLLREIAPGLTRRRRARPRPRRRCASPTTCARCSSSEAEPAAGDTLTTGGIVPQEVAAGNRFTSSLPRPMVQTTAGELWMAPQ